ncbi:MAG: LacI family transcriptional regulator [Spirochaetia bacterium]|nr:LacI family transcriptional regulator [Spirochaetia bacterium]
MSTIKEIAKSAGVSPTTVANVIHGNFGRVSQATRERVERVIAEEKYAPNMGAKILAQSSSRIIGVIMFMEPRWEESVLEDPFSSAILGAMERDIRDNGYFVMLHTTSDEDEVLRLSKAWKLAGLILVWVPGDVCRVIYDTIETPVVFIDSYFSDRDHVYYNVGLQDERGGYLITRYLLSMGHRNMLFLANTSLFTGGDDARFKGCQRAFLENNLVLSDACYHALDREKKVREKFYLSCTDSSNPCTALVFSSDYYAAEAVSTFQDHGIDVPSQISVTGFDDNLFSRLVRPRLTTVHQNASEKGRIAVSMLMRLINKKSVSPPDVRLDVHVVVRDSVKKLEHNGS